MPSSALLPLAPIRHVYVKIHPAIETKDVPLSVIRAKCHEVRQKERERWREGGRYDRKRRR